ncbi:MAG: DUF4870 domain-containing protein [Anaerolineaceae bacterium]|nr:DUF4870 domain-containing protein [Anaerolineaceae bacterium]
MTITKNESTWAMIAHLSNLLNLVTGVLGPVVAIVIYFSYRDKSKYVANQAMQSFIFQLISVIFAGILAVIAWIVTSILSIIIIGICLIPFASILTLIPIAAMAYSIYAAVETAAARPFQYFLIGKWIEN